jgi:ATP adenylyltransferase/5',5'''-P-1,P-4-tetraphosphate phosphorylase II
VMAAVAVEERRTNPRRRRRRSRPSSTLPLNTPPFTHAHTHTHTSLLNRWTVIHHRTFSWLHCVRCFCKWNPPLTRYKLCIRLAPPL